MPRTRSLVCFGSALLAVATGLGAAGSGIASSGASAHAGAKSVTTTITVTAGKPSELAFKLSKYSNLPAGTFTFKVTNRGLAFHDFKICTKPVKLASKNSCAGKGTKVLKPGQSATLTVKLTAKGLYEFLCSVTGHASAGMKGLLGVGVKVPAIKPPATTTTATTTTATTTTATTTTAATTTTTTDTGSACPNGETVQQYLQSQGTAGDRDNDDSGGPDDNDGCL